jgi:hypothetical protein
LKAGRSQSRRCRQTGQTSADNVYRGHPRRT